MASDEIKVDPRRSEALRWLFERGGEAGFSASGKRVLAAGDWSPHGRAIWDGLTADHLVRLEKGRLYLTPMGATVAEGVAALAEDNVFGDVEMGFASIGPCPDCGSFNTYATGCECGCRDCGFSS